MERRSDSPGAILDTDKLLSLLPRGKEHAIKQPELAALYGKTPTELKADIRAARKDHLICSSPRGYWLPGSVAECEVFISMMEKQALGRLSTIKHIRAEVKQFKLDQDQGAGANIAGGGSCRQDG